MNLLSYFHALFSTFGLLLLGYAAWHHDILVAAIGFVIGLQAINHMFVYRTLWKRGQLPVSVDLEIAPPSSTSAPLAN